VAVLLLRPGLLPDRGLQVVCPALAALLSTSLRHVGSNLGPVTSTELLDQETQAVILVRGPGAVQILSSLSLQSHVVDPALV